MPERDTGVRPREQGQPRAVEPDGVRALGEAAGRPSGVPAAPRVRHPDLTKSPAVPRVCWAASTIRWACHLAAVADAAAFREVCSAPAAMTAAPRAAAADCVTCWAVLVAGRARSVAVCPARAALVPASAATALAWTSSRSASLVVSVDPADDLLAVGEGGRVGAEQQGVEAQVAAGLVRQGGERTEPALCGGDGLLGAALLGSGADPRPDRSADLAGSGVPGSNGLVCAEAGSAGCGCGAGTTGPRPGRPAACSART